VLRTKAVYYSDTSSLQPDEKARFDKGWSRATIPALGLQERSRVMAPAALWKFSRCREKAITIRGNGTSRRDADVVVCAEFRRYHSYPNDYNPGTSKVYAFFLPGDVRIENFPEQHHDNGTTKHQATQRLFKPTVRIYKNLRQPN